MGGLLLQDNLRHHGLVVYMDIFNQTDKENTRIEIINQVNLCDVFRIFRNIFCNQILSLKFNLWENNALERNALTIDQMDR